LDLASGIRWKYAYLLDPNGLRIQLVEDIRPGDEKPKKSEIQGVVHVGLGVSDMDRSIAFYSDNLGFDRMLFSFTGHMPEMDPVTGSAQEMKTTILERCAPVSRVASLLRPGIIKLFEVPGRKGAHIFANRRWGDIGCMEFCMDVFDLEGTINALKRKGIKPYLKPVDVDMGSGSRGKVAYIRDPDKTIIEFVEIETVAWLSTPLFMKIAMPLLKIYDSMTKSP
ncbi:MAG: hypothetical protein GXP53_07180, partial [Deltaproteobacteria bacterium]|nr:hypothetical protein [Deltaproteobacteria bacterium]